MKEMKKKFIWIFFILFILLAITGCISSNSSSTLDQTTPSPYLMQKGPVVVLTHHWDSLNSIEGIVKNIGDKPIDKIEIQANFYDSEGDLVVESEDIIHNLEPGYNRTFWIHGTSLQREIKSYKLRIEDYSIRTKTTPSSQSPYKYQTGPVAIIDHEMTLIPGKEYNSIKVTGVVKNIGPDSLKLVEVIVDFYDISWNKLHSAHESFYHMTPDKEYEFTVDFFERFGQYSLYDDESKLVDFYIVYIYYET